MQRECNAVLTLLRSLEAPARSHGAYIYQQILMKIFIFMYSLFIGVWSPGEVVPRGEEADRCGEREGEKQSDSVQGGERAMRVACSTLTGRYVRTTRLVDKGRPCAMLCRCRRNDLLDEAAVTVDL